MPKEERIQTRREEIVSACAGLYQTMGFKDVTIKAIAEDTSFTRPTIYNYFETREEIFLALLQREYEAWAADLNALQPPQNGDGRLALADQTASTLAQRELLLRILATNLNEIEQNSRLKNLVAFKTAYGAAVEALRNAVWRFCPDMAESDVDEVLFTFLPLVYGLYPYTAVSGKQRAAMEQAGTRYCQYSVYDLAFLGLKRLLGINDAVPPNSSVSDTISSYRR